MEDNKRRMEELGLKNLSNSMVKPKVVRQIKKRLTLEEQGLQIRRSTRVAAYQAKEEILRAKEEEEANEESDDTDASGKSDDTDADSEPETPVIRTRYSLRRTRKSPPREEISGGVVEATEAAEDIEKDLENPAFVVSLLESHVTTDILEVPDKFCSSHLPTTNENIMLEDGEGKEWETLFIGENSILGDGWLNFLGNHKLEAGDACVFELISTNRLKVHIVKASEQVAANAAKSSTGKRAKRETKVVDGKEVIDLEGGSGVENNEDPAGSGDEWNPESDSEEEEEEDGDDNWRP